jgi:hypothetical protein
LIEIKAAPRGAAYQQSTMIIAISTAAVALALLLGVAILACLGERTEGLTFGPARQPAKIAVTARSAGRSVNPPLQRI